LILPLICDPFDFAFDFALISSFDLPMQALIEAGHDKSEFLL
jgi:hypothetical protein